MVLQVRTTTSIYSSIILKMVLYAFKLELSNLLTGCIINIKEVFSLVGTKIDLIVNKNRKDTI